MFLRIATLLSFIIIPFSIYSQEVSKDSIHYLNNVVVVGEKREYLSIQDNSTTINMKLMNMMPNILGNADPIHYLQFLPDIQVNNEYDAGLYIQGCDNGHNIVSIDGIPIYSIGHLLGFFSTFNATHYKSIKLSTHPNSSTSPNRLGGNVAMILYDNLPEQCNGQFSVGPISSQGTIRIPLSNNSALIFSGRLSYLNLLYSQWLDIDGSKIKYNFDDFNVTYLKKINEKNTLWIDGYYGLDNTRFDNSFYGINLSMEWGNKMLAAHLKTDISDKAQLKQKIFFTNFNNLLTLKSDYVRMGIPSGISTYGYSANMDVKQITFGVDAFYHSIKLQSPNVSNFYKDISFQSNQHSQEVSTYFDYNLLLKSFLIKMGVRGSFFHGNDNKTYFATDPSLSITYENSNNWMVSLTGYQRHQFLTQTGVSSIGLPLEFWISSTEAIEPQITRGISLSWQKNFSNKYSISVEGFYKKLYNQIEYVGNLLDLKDKDYNLNNYIYPSKGENYGLSFIFAKKTGKIAGWMNYTYTHARRTADNPILGSDYSPSHERPHEFDMVMTYKLNTKWNFGSTFVFASGTAFTAPSSFYYNNGNIVTQYGDYNKNRLPGYIRLDISANYFLKATDKTKYGINFSLFNALNSANPLLYRLKLYQNEYGYKKLSFLMKIMPSVSFFYYL